MRGKIKSLFDINWRGRFCYKNEMRFMIVRFVFMFILMDFNII